MSKKLPLLLTAIFSLLLLLNYSVYTRHYLNSWNLVYRHSVNVTKNISLEIGKNEQHLHVKVADSESEALSAKALDDFHNCPICGHEHLSTVGKKYLTKVWDDKFNLTWMRCSNCSHTFVRPYLSDQNLTDIYSTSYSAQANIGWSKKRGDSQFKTFEQLNLITPEITSLNVVEQGCSLGILLNYFAEFSKTLYCIEPDNDMRADFVTNKNREKLILIRSVEVNDTTIPDNSIDWWLGSHVIEHFPDPNRFVSTAYKKLKMRGIFFQEFPVQVDLVKADLPRDYHLNYYSGKSIHQLLTKHGFCQIAIYKITNVNDILQGPQRWRNVSRTEIHKKVHEQTYAVFRVVYTKCK